MKLTWIQFNQSKITFKKRENNIKVITSARGSHSYLNIKINEYIYAFSSADVQIGHYFRQLSYAHIRSLDHDDDDDDGAERMTT